METNKPSSPDERANLVLMLLRWIDAKDPDTGRHTRRASALAVMIGRAMGLSDTQLELLRIGALLHDIGKISVMEGLLSKPGSLNQDEFAKIKSHTVIGAQMLSSLSSLADLMPFARSHHERVDGSGYPDRLTGDAIPLMVLIYSLADAFEVMTGGRVYQKRISSEKAAEEIRRCSGTQFAHEVVKVFEVLRQKDNFQSDWDHATAKEYSSLRQEWNHNGNGKGS